MFDTDPTGWKWSTWWLYSLSTYYLLGFVYYWLRFRAAERRARRSEQDAARFNRLLRGFPNAVYAKMLGKRPFEVARIKIADPPIKKSD